MLLSTGLDKTLEGSLVSLSQLKTSLTLIIAHHNDKVSESKSLVALKSIKVLSMV